MAEERKHQHHAHLGALGAAAAGGYGLVISLLPALAIDTYTFTCHQSINQFIPYANAFVSLKTPNSNP